VMRSPPARRSRSPYYVQVSWPPSFQSSYGVAAWEGLK
jgi:hypothetical protein